MNETLPIRHPLEDVIGKLTAPAATAEAFVISDGNSNAIRLECHEGELDVALDVFVMLSPDGSTYHLDPYLTADSRFKLSSHGLLPADQFEALELGSWLALRLATAYRARIIETAARRTFCDG